MIDITGTDLRKFIAKAYELSQPQGMGFLHFKEGPLDDESIDKILNVKNEFCVCGMDYVHGRSIKMAVYSKGDRLLIGGPGWYDHSDYQLEELLSADGVVNNGEYVE
jgi:hypothetical protein